MSLPSDCDSRSADPKPPGTAAAAAAIIAALMARNTALQELVVSQAIRIAALERRLGLNSSNSGKPPASDGRNKPRRTQSLRAPSGKKSGGQTGHPGKTLQQVENANATIDHFPKACTGCNGALAEAASKGFTARQVFDLPKPQPLDVTEHRAHVCHCTACGEQTRAAFPEGVAAPVQYGSSSKLCS